MKISSSRSRTSTANSFFPINITCLVVKRVLAVIYNLYLSSRLLKLTSTLLEVKKDIQKVTSMLMLVNGNISSNNQDSPSLSSTWNKIIIISKASSLLLLIFWAPVLVLPIQKHCSLAKLGYITLILLLELLSILT